MAPTLLDMDQLGMEVAYANAKKSYVEGGVPIGAALISMSPQPEDGDGEPRPQVIGSGHNARVQKNSPILHAEIAALANGGRQKPDIYRSSTMYTTLSPCSMCVGAILLYKIPRVVVGENANYMGDEELLRSRGVKVVVLDDENCKALMAKYISEKPEDWYEDIGEKSQD